ncbi:hypothetical protein [Ammoniphilus sp. YIM 78166]|uniref:capping complex subunit for YIEGIA n=1 Tax=Ammoniphilus sp. YIM 78166 TaxID=1644106 RepID=UPI00106FC108|nr:hypothetical protein [Ammoniphilus sp. YIM 78166]
MSQDIKGILAYVTTDKDRYLGGTPLGILAKNEKELVSITEAISKAFLAEVLQLVSGDCLIIKK